MVNVGLTFASSPLGIIVDLPNERWLIKYERSGKNSSDTMMVCVNCKKYNNNIV